jgi:hypothetical protein
MTNLNAPLNAMTDLLDIISNPKTVQTVNDRTLSDATARYAADNPGNTIGRQARYYDAMQNRLNADLARPDAATPAVTPFKPRNG